MTLSSNQSGGRDADLQALLEALELELPARAESPQARAAAKATLSRCRSRVGAPSASAETLPVCAWLAPALERARTALPPALIGPLEQLTPRLAWRQRKGSEAVPAFFAGHANAMLIGPDGFEASEEANVGLTLMAPGVTYVDHRHPPEEVYLALSEGEWRNEDFDWRSPGLGGTLYNRPGVVHAMRSGAQPFLALWLLPL